MRSLQPAIAPARVFVLTATYTILAFVILLNIVSLQPALDQLLDFGSFLAAGKEAIAGNNPYKSDSPLVYSVHSQSTEKTLASPNLNPPLSIVFFRELVNVEPMRAALIWRILSAILFAIGILILGWWYQEFTTPLRVLWAICLAGFWNTVALGQIYAPVFFLAVGAWIFLEKGRNVIAGILLGAMIALKPNFLFWLVLLGLAGYVRTTLSAVATALALSIPPIFMIGPRIYPQWIAALADYPSLGLMIAGNSSLESLAARLGYENLGIVFSLILMGAALYYVHRHKSWLSANQISSLGIVGSILISPFSWPGYAILTLPIFFSRQQWNWQIKMAAAILVFPYLLVLYFFQRSFLHSILFGWLYGWGLLFILVGIFVHRSDKPWGELAKAEHEE